MFINLIIVNIINNIKDIILFVRRKVINYIITLLKSKKKSRNALRSNLKLRIKADII